MVLAYVVAFWLFLTNPSLAIMAFFLFNAVRQHLNAA